MYDYIVVGAGSAGAVVANRLSIKHKVLLIEAGPVDKNMWIHIPAGMARLFTDPAVNWNFSTIEEPHCNNRKIFWPKGKVMGGSSSINGMAYVRGHAKDYDHWRDLGNVGWSYADVLPYFKKSERYEHGENRYHGGSGEMGVTDPLVKHPASYAFIESCKNIGLKWTPDYNAEQQEGVGWLQFTIDKGVRANTGRAFITPIRDRANLTVRTDAQVLKVTLEGRRATGVVLRTKDGATETVKAGEVILSAGAIGSPHILQLSGIGPGAHLQQLGVPVVHDLPGVGGNLQDHLYVHYRMKVKPEFSINSKTRFPGYLPIALQYFATRKGLLGNGVSQAVAFVRSDDVVDRPDLQINFRPFGFGVSPSGALISEPFPSVTASCCHLRPYSRGTVRLASPDPMANPAISANYLSAPEDMEAAKSGLRWMRKMLTAKPFVDRSTGEFVPGPEVTSDADLEKFIREQCQSMYHPVGSCKMGVDADAVVDPKLKVHGIDKLRVICGSIMPTICSGNTNAASVMVGERGAALCLE